jgi:hypothetical protein
MLPRNVLLIELEERSVTSRLRNFPVFSPCIEPYCVIMATLERARIVQSSRRGGHLLLYGGYLYAKNRSRESKIYWRCNVQSCGVFLQTSLCDIQANSEVIVTREPSRHCHGPSGDEYYNKVQLLTKITAAVQVRIHAWLTRFLTCRMWP